MLGKTFKGMTDEILAWQTERLLALAIAATVTPSICSPSSSSRSRSTISGKPALSRRDGAALRPGQALRTDKSVADADTLETVRSLQGLRLEGGAAARLLCKPGRRVAMLTVSAEQKPDFSGRVEAESAGFDAEPDRRARCAERCAADRAPSEPKFTAQQTIVLDGKPFESKFDLLSDGREVVADGGGRRIVSTLHWDRRRVGGHVANPRSRR